MLYKRPKYNIMIRTAQTLSTPGIMRHGYLPGNNVIRPDSSAIKAVPELFGKVALITGESRGSGLEMAQGLCED